MKKIVLFASLLLLASLPNVAYAQLILPAGGVDELPATKATLEVFLFFGSTHLLECGGPARISRSDPVEGMVETEMVALDLACSDGVTLRLDPNRPSTGQIHANGDSFFDVFFEIGGLPGEVRTATNLEAARVQGKIAHIPPFGATYFGVRSVSLVSVVRQPDQPDQIVQVGELIHVKHEVNGQSKPETSGEVSPVFSCFYECKVNPFSPALWTEVTTLMLANQSAKQHTLASILFVDGNQRPLAQTKTVLSPEDLDEINVCETLNLGGVPVPPAGLIEVVLQPTGGVYGWMKNVIGRFVRGRPEPFEGFVTGTGKTECRLVGPNVVTPREILEKMAANVRPVNPVLIEKTAE